MTGEQCFMAAMNLLAEQEEGATYYRAFALGAVNQLLANCQRENNALREAAGQQTRLTPPILAALEDEIECDEAMVCECFPYGLAALLVCDEDKAKFNWLATEFAERVDRHCPAVLFPVEELY